MNKMHDTDQLFRDAAKHYREKPGEGAWAHIDAAIQSKRKKKYVLFWSGIAAVSILLLGFGAGYLVRSVTLQKTEIANVIPPQQKAFATPDFTFSEIVEEMFPSRNDKFIQDESIAKNLLSGDTDKNSNGNSNKSLITIPQNQDNKPLGNNISVANKEVIETAKDNVEKNMGLTSGDTMKRVEESKEFSSVEKNAMLNSMLTHAPESADAGELHSGGYSSPSNFQPPQSLHKDHQWSVGGDLAAAYAYRKIDNADESFSDRSPIAEESGVVSWNAGVYAMGYISDNLSIKTGLSYASYGQGTQNIYAWESKDFFHINSSLGSIETSISRAEYSNANISNSGIYDEAQSLLLDNSMLMSGSDLSNSEMIVIQRFNYVEFPLMVQLSTRRKSSPITLHAEGGVYTGVLAENQAFLRSGNDTYSIGSTEGLRQFSFGGVAAAGAGISLGKSLSAEITPELRYSFLSISKLSTIAYHPYQFSIGLGLFYHF